MKRIRLLALFLVILAAFSLRADDFDLWTTAGVEKKIDKKSSAEIEGEIRMADKMKRVSRWRFCRIYLQDGTYHRCGRGD